jgi:hypothetical protein
MTTHAQRVHDYAEYLDGQVAQQMDAARHARAAGDGEAVQRAVDWARALNRRLRAVWPWRGA